MLTKLKNKLDAISRYEKNWNYYNAEPIFDLVLIKANSFIEYLNNNKLLYDVEMFPTGRSTIQFEWETDNGYLEIEILKDAYDIMEEDKINTIINEDIITNLEELKIIIKNFIDKYYENE